MLLSPKNVLMGIGLLCLVAPFASMLSSDHPSRITTVSRGAIAEQVTAPTDDAAAPTRNEAGVPFIHRGSGVAFSEIRIARRGKDHEVVAAVIPARPGKRVAAAPPPQPVESSGAAPLLVPPMSPSVPPTFATPGGFGPVPALFAALIGGVAIAAFQPESPEAPIVADSVPTTPGTQPPTVPGTPPTTPPVPPTPPTPPSPPVTPPTPPVTPPTPPVTPPVTPPTPPVIPTGTVPPPEVPVTTTPEPSTFVMLASGLVAVAFLRRRTLTVTKAG